MPWSSVKQVPKKYQKTFRKKGYSAKQKRAWLKTFNNAIKKGDESYAFAVAWSVANKLKESIDLLLTETTFKEWVSRPQTKLSE